jgi:hypothetical protein
MSVSFLGSDFAFFFMGTVLSIVSLNISNKTFQSTHSTYRVEFEIWAFCQRCIGTVPQRGRPLQDRGSPPPVRALALDLGDRQALVPTGYAASELASPLLYRNIPDLSRRVVKRPSEMTTNTPHRRSTGDT